MVDKLRSLLHVGKKEEGDPFEVFVHIAECRDLKPLSSDDVPDPICTVQILKDKKSTMKQKETFSPHFDQLLTFRLTLSAQQFESEKIKITVFDTNSSLRNDPLGSYSFDVSSIYNQTDHEIYNQWTGLFNPKFVSQGIKGYIKLSIAVLAPDDIKKHHDPRDAAEGDEGAMKVILPPFIQYSYKQLVVNVLSTRYLPDVSGRFTPTYSLRIEFGDTRLRSKEVLDEGPPEQTQPPADQQPVRPRKAVQLTLSHSFSSSIFELTVCYDDYLSAVSVQHPALLDPAQSTGEK